MEIAVFGGTFDPPTRAHEAIMQACLDRSDIDEVWVMPSGERTDKTANLADTDRLWMLSLLHEEILKSNPRLKISRFELDYMQRPTQTWRTAEALKARYPDCNFHFVFGADAYYGMPSWEQGETLQRTLGLLLVARCGQVVPDAPNVEALYVAGVDSISSTEVRSRVAAGLPIDRFVCRSVAEYITDCRLYRKAGVQ